MWADALRSPQAPDCLGCSPSKGVVTLVVDRKAAVCLSEVGGTHWGSRVSAWATPGSVFHEGWPVS